MGGKLTCEISFKFAVDCFVHTEGNDYVTHVVHVSK